MFKDTGTRALANSGSLTVTCICIFCALKLVQRQNMQREMFSSGYLVLAQSGFLRPGHTHSLVLEGKPSHQQRVDPPSYPERSLVGIIRSLWLKVLFQRLKKIPIKRNKAPICIFLLGSFGFGEQHGYLLSTFIRLLKMYSFNYFLITNHLKGTVSVS